MSARGTPCAMCAAMHLFSARISFIAVESLYTAIVVMTRHIVIDSAIASCLTLVTPYISVYGVDSTDSSHPTCRMCCRMLLPDL